MATKFYINPAKVIIFPPNIDDNVVNGVEFGVTIKPSPTLATLTISTGRVRINSRFYDIANETGSNYAYELNLGGISNNTMTRWGGGLNGVCLMVMDDSKAIGFVNDNVPSDKLVLAIIERRQVGPDTLFTVTPIDYSGSMTSGSGSSNIDVPTDTSVQTQLQMLFEEMAINKAKDAYLKYEEMLESLADFNNAFVETFASSALFLTNELAYNAYTKTVGLGIVAPYPANITRKLVESVTLLNPVTKICLSVDALANGQTMTTRISFDNGVTWQNHVGSVESPGDQVYNLSVPVSTVRVEFSMMTNTSATSPMLRSWGILYLKS